LRRHVCGAGVVPKSAVARRVRGGHTAAATLSDNAGGSTLKFWAAPSLLSLLSFKIGLSAARKLVASVKL
jgi:hypothetical protein